MGSLLSRRRKENQFFVFRCYTESLGSPPIGMTYPISLLFQDLATANLPLTFELVHGQLTHRIVNHIDTFRFPRIVLYSLGGKIIAAPTRTDRKCGFDLVLSDQQPTDSLSAGLPIDGETS